MFRVWNIAENKCIKFFRAQHSIALEMDLQQSLVAAGTTDHKVCVYDYRKGYLTHLLEGHRGIITRVAFHPQSEKAQVIASSVDNSIRVWDLLLNSCIAVLGYAAPCSTFCFTPEGDSLISAHRDKHVLVWNLSTRLKTANLELDEEVEAMHYIAKKKATYLALFGEKGQCRIVNMANKEAVFTAKEPVQPFLRCAYVKSRSELVGVTAEQTLISYKLSFGEDGVPALEHVRDSIGFHDEIIDVAIDSARKKVVMATNSPLLK